MIQEKKIKIQQFGKTQKFILKQDPKKKKKLATYERNKTPLSIYFWFVSNAANHNLLINGKVPYKTDNSEQIANKIAAMK